MKNIYGQPYNVYNKKNIKFQSKVRHYTLQTAEVLTLNLKNDIENIQKNVKLSEKSLNLQNQKKDTDSSQMSQ